MTPGGPPVVDVHHHFLPATVFERLKAMAGGARRLVTDRISMTLSEDLHDVDGHLEVMEAGGVDAALLTYSGVSVLGMAICRSVNDGLAEVQRDQPGRLWGAAHVALDEPLEAPAELERCAAELGFRSVALPTSAPGVTLDAPALDPLWEAVVGLGLPVVLHPALLPQGASTEHNLERSCYRPFDTTTAVVRLMAAVLPRYPGLRFVLPHLGGAAMILKGRLAMFYEPPGWPDPTGRRHLPRTRAEQRELGLDEPFEAAWSSFWFDTAGTGAWAPAVGLAATVAGPDRLLFGSDYPLESHSAATLRELVAIVGSLGLDGAAERAVLCGNAEGLLGITAEGGS